MKRKKISIEVDAEVGEVVNFITDNDRIPFMIIGYIMYGRDLKYLLKNQDSIIEAFSCEIEILHKEL